MHCTQCGYEFERQPKFCPECGARQAAPVPGADKQSQAEQQTQDTVSRPDPVHRQAYDAAHTFYQPQPVSGQHQTDKNKQEQLHRQRLAYIRQDYNPGRDGTFRQPDFRQSGGTGGQPLPDAGPMPSATGMIIFSIINMIFFGLGISLVLGTVALVFSILSTGEKTAVEAAGKLNTARILNIIGLVFLLIQLILIFVIAAASFLYVSRTF